MNFQKNQSVVGFAWVLAGLAMWGCPKSPSTLSADLCKKKNAEPLQLSMRLEGKQKRVEMILLKKEDEEEEGDRDEEPWEWDSEEGKGTWGRDDALYVQLKGLEGMDFGKLELFAGKGLQHRAVLVDCPRHLPEEPHAKCFEVQLSALPHVPHGPYELHLTAHLVNEAGECASKSQSFRIKILRMLWLSEEGAARFSVVTREGLLLSLIREEGHRRRTFLAATHAQGKRAWRARVPEHAGRAGNLLLGNHRGMDVVLALCSPSEGIVGFYAVEAKSGKALSSFCTKTRYAEPNIALLQGGPHEDLVVVRRVILDLSPEEARTYALEACRLEKSPEGMWGFRCEETQALPPGGHDSKDGMLSQTFPGGVSRVFIGSLERHWCAMEWRSQGGWSQGCIAQGPPVTEGELRWAQTQYLSSKRLWVSYEGEDGGLTRVFDWQARMGEALPSLPLLVDVDDTWFALGEDRTLQRVFASGQKLYEKKVKGLGELAMTEEGLVFLGGDLGILCLKSDGNSCWAEAEEEEEIRGDGHGWLMGVLPLVSEAGPKSNKAARSGSPGRSVAVFGYSVYVMGHHAGLLAVGFLLDSPGLKKEAPWPTYGHDLCRSFNTSVPVDNCWDGPNPAASISK